MKKELKKVWDIITLENYLHRNLSSTVANSVAPANSDFSKYLITIASSILTLSFAILQFFGKGELTVSISVLKFSWYAFVATILLGLIFHILELLRSFFESNDTRMTEGLTIDEILASPDKNKILKNAKRVTLMARYSYLLLVLQIISFFVGALIFFIFLQKSF